MGYGGSYATTYNTITVGASAYVKNPDGSCTDTAWSESNFGACVSIWAPGADVKVAITSGTEAYATRPGGSSFSAALVTGAVARLLPQYPSLSATAVWTELENRANSRNVLPPDFDRSEVTIRKLLYISATE